MVLCYSRMMYVEFTVSQTLEHFLGCHRNAFEFFQSRVPARIMDDNLKSAIVLASTGDGPVAASGLEHRAVHFGIGLDHAPCVSVVPALVMRYPVLYTGLVTRW